MNAEEPASNCSEAAMLPANKQAKWIILLLLTFTVCFLPLFYLRREWQITELAAYALPALTVIALLLAIRITREGTADAPLWVLLPGLLFIMGGAVFDMVATVIHTPDLNLEQNPIARTLLDSGHSVPFVYSYALVCQSLCIGFIGILWAGLLRHRHSIRDSVSGHHSFVAFVKAANGGSNLSWRQFLMPMRVSELPHAYHVLWLTVVVLVAMSAYRWYLGLEWFGIHYGAGVWIATAAVLLGLTLYLAWLWRANLPTE